MTNAPSKKDAARRRGSLFGILVFAVIVTTFTAVCSVEIIVQAWAKPGSLPARPLSGERPAVPESR